MAIERADVCLILIDANEGVTEQDTKVAGMAHESGKACIIVVNKWDAVDKDDKTMDRMRQDIRRDLSYMTYAPIALYLGPHRAAGGPAVRADPVRKRPGVHAHHHRHAQQPFWPMPPPGCSPPRTRGGG